MTDITTHILAAKAALRALEQASAYATLTPQGVIDAREQALQAARSALAAYDWLTAEYMARNPNQGLLL